MSKLGKELIHSMEEALAHAKGERTPKVRRIKVGAPNMRRVRQMTGLSQDRFAQVIGVSPSTFRKWEQGQRQPSGAAAALFRVIEKAPKQAIKALLAD